MSTKKAKKCFEENIQLYPNPKNEPEKHNLYKGLYYLAKSGTQTLLAATHMCSFSTIVYSCQLDHFRLFRRDKPVSSLLGRLRFYQQGIAADACSALFQGGNDSRICAGDLYVGSCGKMVNSPWYL